jgi:multidrug efflux system membrane fusion protein
MLFRKNEFDNASAEGRSLIVSVQRGPLATRIGLALIGMLLLAGIAYWLFGGGKPAAQAMPPAQVAVALPLQRSIIEYDEFTGRFEPSRTVEIRPRVSGQLRAVHFRDGDYVRQGQLLFTIDRRPFQAALAEAQARVAAARAASRLAAVQLTRAQRLLPKGFVSRDSFDIRQEASRSAQADIAAAEAVVRQRALDLEFTQVRAPVSGRISDRRADPGTLLAGGTGGEATLLTTINAVDPIYFTFDVSEALLLKAQRERGTGAGQRVEIRLQDEPDYRWRGTVDFTDNGIARDSGTLRARAVVPNPDGFLVPGIFGSMRLSSGRPVNVLLVPDSAVLTDQAGKVVMTIAKNGQPMPVPVTVGPVIDGLRVIRTGLAPDAKVVIRGHQRMMPGLPIKATMTRIKPDPTKAASPAAVPPAASSATFAASGQAR